MCSSDYDYSYSFAEEKEVTARKEHVCHECRLPIAPRERYIRFAGHGDGEFFYFKIHMACHLAAQSWPGNCRSPYGGLLQDLFDCDLEKPTRDIWAKHLWRFRKNPLALRLRIGKRRKPWRFY